MTCSECLDLMLDLAQGRPLAASAEQVRAHVDECESCSTAYAEISWLSQSLRSTRREIEDGHIASRLLVEFARVRDELSAGAIDLVESHVAKCDSCRQDLETAERLSRITLDAPIPVSRPRPRTRRPVPRWRRQLPVYAAAAVLVVAVSLQILPRTEHSTREVAEILTAPAILDVGHRIVRLQAQPVARGAAHDASPDARVLGPASDSTVILGLEVVTFEEPGVTYEARILDTEGIEVWSAAVESTALASGSLWIALHHDRLTAGTYELVVAETKDGLRTVVSRGAFEIIR